MDYELQKEDKKAHDFLEIPKQTQEEFFQIGKKTKQALTYYFNSVR